MRKAGNRGYGWRVFLVALIALAGGSATAATVNVEGPAAATPGGVVTVRITLSPDLSFVYAIQGGLAYDPAALTLLENEGAAGGYHAGAAAPFPGENIPKDADLFRMNAAEAGRVVFGYVKNPSNPAGSPSVTVPPVALSLSFRVAEGAAGATALSLSPYVVNGRTLPSILLGGINGAGIEATVGDSLSVVLTLRGDADGDGAVTMADVLLAMRAAGGQAAQEGAALRLENADVWPVGAPDGRITLEDALRIGRFVSGMETDLN